MDSQFKKHHDRMLWEMNRGNFSAALEAGEKALEAARRGGNDRHPNYVVLLNNLALVHIHLGELSVAKLLLARVFVLLSEGVESTYEIYLSSLNNQALLYRNLGQFKEAEDILQKVTQLHRDIDNDQSLEFTCALVNLGDCQSALSYYDLAAESYSQAKEIAENCGFNNMPLYATLLNNIGLLEQRRGRYMDAIVYHNNALEKQGEIFDCLNTEIATSLNNIALCHFEIGDFLIASSTYDCALFVMTEMKMERHPGTATIHFNKGMVAYCSRHFAEAMKEFELSRTIRYDVFGNSHPEYAASLNGLALVHFEMGDYGKVKELHEQALQIRKICLGEFHPDYLTSLGNSAINEMKLGQAESAGSKFEYVLDCMEKTVGELHPLYLKALINTGSSKLLQGCPVEARNNFEQAARILLVMLQNFSVSQSQRQQLETLCQYRFLVDLLLSAYLNSSVEFSAQIAERIWNWKGIVTRRIQNDVCTESLTNLTDLGLELQRLNSKMSSLACQISSIPTDTNDESSYRLLKQREQSYAEYVSCLFEREKLESKIFASRLRYRAPLELMTTERIQELLPVGFALIDFFELSHWLPNGATKSLDKVQEFLACVVRKDHAVVIVNLGDASYIKDLVGRFRTCIISDQISHPSGAPTEELVPNAGRELRKVIWEPIEQLLGAEKKIILSPDSEIGLVPFAALAGKLPDSFLIEEYQFVYQPYVQLLERTRKEKNVDESLDLLIVSDVDYNWKDPMPRRTRLSSVEKKVSTDKGSFQKTWKCLFGFKEEGDAIAQIYKNHFHKPPIMLEKESASKAKFLFHSSRANTIHLITHGFVEELNPFDSNTLDPFSCSPRASSLPRQSQDYRPVVQAGIVLTGANSSESSFDGILTVAEIQSMDLRKVNLAVLSACETAVGLPVGGENFISLQRAFHLAGTLSCITSLWKIRDSATVELMRRFYTYYWSERLTKADALHKAQLDLLNGRISRSDDMRGLLAQTLTLDPKMSSQAPPIQRLPPEYWAAFQLTGDWR